VKPKDIHWKKFFWVPTLLAALVGFIAGDLGYFRSDNRKVMDREFSEVQQEVKKVSEDIRLLTNKARGKAEISNEQLRMFKNNITSLHQSAKELSQHVPEAQPEFRAYVTAMIKLQQSANEMSGPLDARPFVESLSGFLKAQDEFIEKVQEAQDSYF